MESEKMLLTEEQLNNVCGGDYGDADRDNKDISMYEVGQYVETYFSAFHYSTCRAKIISKRRLYNGTWKYKVDYDSRFEQEEFTANEIERRH